MIVTPFMAASRPDHLPEQLTTIIEDDCHKSLTNRSNSWSLAKRSNPTQAAPNKKQPVQDRLHLRCLDISEPSDL